ncbi:MAG: hypothetical protein JO247_11645, partial [Chloroflexi bacterium]|nr:hypothetical protein [Chloroflexota bacterium]
MANPAQREPVTTDIRVSGELMTPTAIPTGAAAAPGSGSPTQRATLAPVSFQTFTPVATPHTDVAAPLAVPGADTAVTVPRQQPAPPAQVGPGVPGSSFPRPPATATPPPAPTPTDTPVLLAQGASFPINLPAGTATCDTDQTFTFNYPGDNSTVTVDAQLDGLSPNNEGQAGFN